MTDKATGKAVIAGEIEAVEPDGANYKTKLGLLIVFDSAEALRNALGAHLDGDEIYLLDSSAMQKLGIMRNPYGL